MRKILLMLTFVIAFSGCFTTIAVRPMSPIPPYRAYWYWGEWYSCGYPNCVVHSRYHNNYIVKPIPPTRVEHKRNFGNTRQGNRR